MLKTVPLAPSAELPVPIYGGTLRDCQRMLSSRSSTFVGIFINPALGHPGWLALVKVAHTVHPNCPIYLVCDKPHKMSPEEQKKLKISKILRKPQTYAKLLAELGIAHLSPKTALSVEAEPPVKDDPRDELYVPVRTITLLLQRPLEFDIYVKLSSGHYTKLWNNGDIVDVAQLDHQAEKGVLSYFVLREDQEACLEACDAGILRLLDDASIPIDIKTDEVLAAGAATIEFLRAQGVTAENIALATNYAVAAQKVAAEMARHNDHLKKFLLDTAVQDHGIATAILGALVIHNMKAPPGDMFNKLNVAFMFHDIALWDESEILQDEDETRMTPEQIAIFHAHPANGAKILRELSLFPSGLLEAIESHHMRLGRLGFPPHQGVSKIMAFAELIGVCSEFAHVINKSKPEDQAQAYSNFLKRVRVAFSPAIVAAFDRAFCSIGPLTVNAR